LHDINKLPPLKRLFFKCVTNQIESYVAVGPEIADKLIKGGCPKNKVSVIPGFTPPDEEELFDPKSISVDLEWFLEKHNPIIMANASGVVFCNGRDLYGLDMCVELASRLRGHFANLGFIYAIAPGGHGSMDHWDYLERMREMSREKNLESHFYFRICSEPLTPLLRRCDVFVRPTCTDGDSNSVREALYLGKPVAASDAVSRPEGCLIFRDGDINDFAEKVVMILSNYASHKRRIQELKASFPHYELLRLYARVLSL
jgi:glycosyltransferase involved in cell wall biosynthesis